MSVPLTAHLTSLSTPRPYSAATEHAFLTAAGTGTLPPALLSLYLSQDRIYAAHAYPRFLGHLLTHVPFSSRHAPDSPEERLHGEIVDVLAGALQNVRREVGLFAEVKRAHGLPPFAQWRERKATRDYTAEMARVGAFGTLEDGLIFLWAMERVYLDAWTYAKSLLSNATTGTGPALPAIQQLVENWTCPAFVEFVQVLEGLVNRLDIAPGSPAYLRAEEIWARVLELEEAFWPVGGEEMGLLSM
ncbi:heme oxygenase-like protein [Cubamyces sp. BRFM 1775]|nr:heme oxygenase-like protein [Cubamyces sp. BRFM 1775]